MKVRKVRATILGFGVGGGVLTPDLCQICKKGGPGIVSVKGMDGVTSRLMAGLARNGKV